MSRITQFIIAGIFIQSLEAAFSLYKLYVFGYSYERDISVCIMIFFMFLLFCIAARYLSIKKLVIFSFVLSISFSFFSAIVVIVIDGGFYSFNYIFSSGTLTYLFVFTPFAFIFNMSIIGVILLFRKVYTYYKAKRLQKE